MLRRLYLILLFILAAAQNFAEAKDTRRLTYSSTSFDLGFVDISVDSDRHALAHWTWDPFLHPKPKTQPWKKEIEIDANLAAKIFSTLDEIHFEKIQSGRVQGPDDPSVTYEYWNGRKMIHSVTFLTRDVPPIFEPLDSLLRSVYDKAKAAQAENLSK